MAASPKACGISATLRRRPRLHRSPEDWRADDVIGFTRADARAYRAMFACPLYRSGRFAGLAKVQEPEAGAVKREAEEEDGGNNA